jgi:hypothetical protein
MYLFVIATFLVGSLITNRFEVSGDFLASVQRVTASELLYRAGLCIRFLASLCTVFLAMGLYGAVKPAGSSLALLALIFRLVEATIGGVGSIFSFILLKLYTNGDYVNAFSLNQLSAFTGLYTEWSAASLNIACIFFSMGSILFFYLFRKGNYIPRILSGLGLFASLLVTLTGFANLLSAHSSPMLQFGWLPMFVAEISVGLWLLIKGVNLHKLKSEDINRTNAKPVDAGIIA